MACTMLIVTVYSSRYFSYSTYGLCQDIALSMVVVTMATSRVNKIEQKHRRYCATHLGDFGESLLALVYEKLGPVNQVCVDLTREGKWQCTHHLQSVKVNS